VRSLSVIVYFNEAEASGLAGEAIPHYIYTIHGNAGLRKKIL
jgi:hypothetical protein